SGGSGSGGSGSGPEGPGGPGGSGGRDGDKPGLGGQGGPGPGGLRWDPTDPVQRRARYALLSGMWAFFFALFSVEWMALLLGVLALYWGISSLRNKIRDPEAAAALTTGSGGGSSSGEGAAGGQPGGQPGGQSSGGMMRPQRSAAMTGIVAACLALVFAAGMYAVQFVYHDYFTCQSDALTKVAEKNCESKLPEPLRKIFGQDAG
ncbi:hypothetical protein G5C51_41235, partial [Streptomyces sp. A7024]